MFHPSTHQPPAHQHTGNISNIIYPAPGGGRDSHSVTHSGFIFTLLTEQTKLDLMKNCLSIQPVEGVIPYTSPSDARGSGVGDFQFLI